MKNQSFRLKTLQVRSHLQGSRKKLSFKNVSSVVVSLLHSIKYTVDVPFANMTMSSAAASALLNGEGEGEGGLFQSECGVEESSGKTLRKPFMKRHSAEMRPVGRSNRVNKYLSQAIEGRSIDQEKSTHVNLFTLCFKDRAKERLYHEDKDTGFVTSLSVTLLLLILLTTLQVLVLPTTLLLLLLFASAFTWILALLLAQTAIRLEVRSTLMTHFSDTNCEWIGFELMEVRMDRFRTYGSAKVRLSLVRR